jgi:hypothetical protein
MATGVQTLELVYLQCRLTGHYLEPACEGFANMASGNHYGILQCHFGEKK